MHVANARASVEPANSRYDRRMWSEAATLATLVIALGVIGEGGRRILAAVLAVRAELTAATREIRGLTRGLADVVAAKNRDHERLERMVERLDDRQNRHEVWHDKH